MSTRHLHPEQFKKYKHPEDTQEAAINWLATDEGHRWLDRFNTRIEYHPEGRTSGFASPDIQHGPDVDFSHPLFSIKDDLHYEKKYPDIPFTERESSGGFFTWSPGGGNEPI